MVNQDIISNFNMLSEKVFKVLEKEVYSIIDNILDITPDILKKEPLKYLIVDGEINGIILICNTLLIFYILHFLVMQLISVYNGKSIENIYYFLIKIIVIGIFVNNSYFICELIFKLFEGISSGVSIFCKKIIGDDISFSILKDNIYKIKGIEKSDFVSIEGLIKGMISFGSISVLITLSIRYVTIIFLVIISPIAILGFCSNITSGFSKTWFKTLFTNLSVQIFVKFIILIPISYKDTNSTTYKVILLGTLYLLYKLNSFISQLFSRISERVN